MWKQLSYIPPEKYLALLCQLIPVISCELYCWLAELQTPAPLVAEDAYYKLLSLHCVRQKLYKTVLNLIALGLDPENLTVISKYIVNSIN